ncbi:MAG TPA: class I SAM-dependent methyltransferase [Stellaceae bacterium]|nr:class I SAM-dependent methyltransferase [Stellaceae bacterium]
MGRIRVWADAARQCLPLACRKPKRATAPAEPPLPPAWQPRNDRETCVCGAPRRDIPNNVWVCPDPDPVSGKYYYRCECGTLSSVNLFFNEASYSAVPIEEYSIPNQKWQLNRARIEWIRARIPADFPETAVVYDLGAGEGCFTSCWLAAYPNSRLFAVETDTRMRERFAAEYSGAEFVCERIETFLKEVTRAPAADLIVLCDVLEHVLEPETLLRLIAEALKPSGFAYITVPNVESYGRFPQPAAAEEVDWDVANWTCQHLWMMEPRVLNDLVNRTFTIQEMSRSFEFQLRGDSDYSTFLVQRPFAKSLWVPCVEQPPEAAGD